MADEKPSVDSVFCAAIAIESAEERQKYVAKVCGQYAELFRQVDRLLRAHYGAGSFLESPPDGVAPSPTIDQPITEKPGTVIGPYKLLQQIGEGGFGVVYMAEQVQPVKRRVALKIIKPGMDTHQVIARFEAERQALAMMDHPNIARVLDAGTTHSGRPYFVMELVKGVPITRYCDEHHLTPRQRLELFVPVCHAIQHAHQKGIIHRDIKPSNVLVGEYDDRPVPRIIDFGVAKATEQRLTEKTVFTQFGQIVGTVDYMSPEQAKLNELDIDTRSDIYSLGVLLYELLTGETPFDRQRLRAVAFDELLRIIREEEPPKPSLRLSTSVSLPSIAANRHIEPKKLNMLIRGELDWIVMKALEKDRTRRYETANGFANDIQRYMNDEQVVACPPSVGYRFRKFARRNKVALAIVSVAAAVLMAVAIGAGIAAAKFRDLAAEKQTALNSAVVAEQAATKARDLEQEQREKAERQTKIATDALADAQRQRERAEENFGLARSAVDKFLNQVTENELLTVPGLQSLREELLSSAMEFYDNFTQDAENASELQIELAAAHHRIAVIRGELGQGEQSKSANAKSIELFERLRDAGHDSLDVRLGLAKAYFRAQRCDDTVTLCRSILDTDAKHAEARSLLAETYNSLAVGQKDNAAALKYHQQALSLREELVRDFPDQPEYLAGLGSTLNNLGVLLGRQGKHHEALTMFERGVGYKAEAYRHAPQTILWGRWLGIGLRNVAAKQSVLGNQQEALKSCERLVAVRRKLAFENPAIPSLKGDLYKAYLDLGNFQKDLGDTAAANRSLRSAQEVLENIPRDTPDELFKLATVYGALATPDEGATEPTEADLDDQQRYADLAMETVVRAVDAGYQNLKALQSHKHLAVLRERKDYQQLTKGIQAEQLTTTEADTDGQKLANRREAVDVLRELIGGGSAKLRHRTTLAATLHSIGEIQIGLKQYEEAEKSLQEALEIRKQIRDEKPDDSQAAIDALAVQISIGKLSWAKQDYPKAHECWQACLSDSLQVAQVHRDDSVLQARLAVEERKICTPYARCGLWPLVREFGERNTEFRRMIAVRRAWETTDAQLSAVMLGHDDQDLIRDYFRQLAESLRNVEDRPTFEFIVHAVQGLAAFGDKDLISEELLSRFQSIFDERSDSEWIVLGMAMVHYCHGRYTEAQSVLAAFHNSTRARVTYLDAAVAMKLGDRQQALAQWSKAETQHRQECRDALAKSDIVGVFGKYWWDSAYDQAMRRLASEVVLEKPALDDPWQHLIQARGYRMLGETGKAEAELVAATAAAPTDRDIQLALARVLSEWDEVERAEAEWNGLVDVAGDDPMPWIHRGRWYAEQGEHEKADADFAKAASLTPNELHKFLEAGWWLVGPYPPNLDEICPPEIDPDPSRSVPLTDPETGLSDEAVRWQSVPTHESALVLLSDVPGGRDWDGTDSYYGLSYVFSPNERAMLLRPQFGKGGIRIWLNGIELRTPTQMLPADCSRIPVVLRPGRNEILVKCTELYRLYLGDSPLDHAFTLIEQGRWNEVAAIVREHTPGPRFTTDLNHIHVLASAVACANDEHSYNRLTEYLVDRATANWELDGLTVSPNRAFEEHSDKLVGLANQFVHHFPDNRDCIRTTAGVLYRAGQFEQAQRYLDQIPEGGWAFDGSLPLRALVCWKRDQRVVAHQFLTRALRKLETITNSNGVMLPSEQRGDFEYSLEVASFWARLREAQREITGSDKDMGVTLRASMTRQHDYWSNVDPATAPFDQAVFTENWPCERPRVHLARGNRLAELERWDEAEADFSKAVSLAPDDPDVIAARAEFYAEWGDVEKSATDFENVLRLLDVPWEAHPIGFALARRADVLDRLIEMYPDRDDWVNRLWHLRGVYQARLGLWDKSLQSLAEARRLGYPDSVVELSIMQMQGRDEQTFEPLQTWIMGYQDRPSISALLMAAGAWADVNVSDVAESASDFLDDEPLSPVRRQILGLAYYRDRRYENALDTLQQSMTSERWQLDALAWPVLAMTHQRLGHRTEARRFLDKTKAWVDLTRTAAGIPHAIGKGNIDVNVWAMAQALYTEAKELIDGPESLAAERERLAAQETKLRLERARRAEANFQRLVDQADGDPVAWLRRARHYANQGEYEKSMADLDKAVALAPDDPRGRRMRGELHEKLDQWDKALADYQRTIELEPDNWDSWKARTEQFAADKQWEKAIDLYSKLIELELDDTDLYHARARMRCHLGQWNEAIEDCREAVEISPQNKECWQRLFEVELLSDGTAEGRNTILEEAKSALGSTNDLLVQHAAWHLLSGRREEYARICRDHAQGRFGLAVVCAVALADEPVVDTRELVERARSIVEADPAPSSWKQHVLGLCLLRDRQTDEAIACFRKSLGRGQYEPRNWLGLAIAHGTEGRMDDAKDWLCKAQEFFREKPLDLPSTWNPIIRMYCQVLLREAEELIAPKPAVEDGSGETTE